MKREEKLKKSIINMEYEAAMSTTPIFQSKKEIINSKTPTIVKTGRKGKTINSGDDTK